TVTSSVRRLYHRGLWLLSESPSGGSIFVMLAPRSRSRSAAIGPGTFSASVITRMPARGGVVNSIGREQGHSETRPGSSQSAGSTQMRRDNYVSRLRVRKHETTKLSLRRYFS